MKSTRVSILDKLKAEGIKILFIFNLFSSREKFLKLILRYKRGGEKKKKKISECWLLVAIHLTWHQEGKSYRRRSERKMDYTWRFCKKHSPVRPMNATSVRETLTDRSFGFFLLCKSLLSSLSRISKSCIQDKKNFFSILGWKLFRRMETVSTDGFRWFLLDFSGDSPGKGYSKSRNFF